MLPFIRRYLRTLLGRERERQHKVRFSVFPEAQRGDHLGPNDQHKGIAGVSYHFPTMGFPCSTEPDLPWSNIHPESPVIAPHTAGTYYTQFKRIVHVVSRGIFGIWESPAFHGIDFRNPYIHFPDGVDIPWVTLSVCSYFHWANIPHFLTDIQLSNIAIVF